MEKERKKKKKTQDITQELSFISRAVTFAYFAFEFVYFFFTSNLIDIYAQLIQISAKRHLKTIDDRLRTFKYHFSRVEICI